MPKRSWIWEFYSGPENNYVTCNACNKKLKFDKCTTNLIKHMKTHNISKPDNSDISIVDENYSFYQGTLSSNLLMY